MNILWDAALETAKEMSLERAIKYLKELPNELGMMDEMLVMALFRVHEELREHIDLLLPDEG